MNDSELDHLIRQSRTEAEFPASFQREVWARIAAVENRRWSTRWSQWSESLLASLTRPVPACSVLSLTLVAGIALGVLSSGDTGQGASRESYLASIDPLRMHELSSQR